MAFRKWHCAHRKIWCTGKFHLSLEGWRTTVNLEISIFELRFFKMYGNLQHIPIQYRRSHQHQELSSGETRLSYSSHCKNHVDIFALAKDPKTINVCSKIQKRFPWLVVCCRARRECLNVSSFTLHLNYLHMSKKNYARRKNTLIRHLDFSEAQRRVARLARYCYVPSVLAHSEGLFLLYSYYAASYGRICAWKMVFGKKLTGGVKEGQKCLHFKKQTSHNNARFTYGPLQRTFWQNVPTRCGMCCVNFQ